MSEIQDHQEYRDTIATVDKQGKRIWIFPKKPGGKYYNWRTIVSVFLLTILFATPWISIDGNPMMLFNVIERKFSIFGKVFWPQDFHLFVIGMITMVVFITLFTVIYGRIFCGWVCPQTIFMEMVFRKIEYWIEGDYKYQKKLKKSPWNTEKIIKKGSKHFVFFVISFLISNTFLAYIIGGEELLKIVTDDPTNHIGGLSAIVLFTFAFYFVFAKLREQVCTTICPYGRLQSVLLDKKSVVISYDNIRGESRAKFKKNEIRKDQGKGDCIDCGHCVDVCPTGIDIRNGTQLECVNCTACIDACDHMMEAVGLKKGLIRYASEEEINTGKKFTWNARSIGYSFVLLGLLVLLTSLLYMRNDVETTILRTPGILFQKQPDGSYTNIYSYKILNKTNNDMEIRFEELTGEGRIELVGDKLNVKERSSTEGAFIIFVEPDHIQGITTKLEIGVFEGDRMIEKIDTKFLGPNKTQK